MKKIIGLFFVLVILIGYEIPVFAFAFESDNTEQKLVGVDATETDSTEQEFEQELVSVELYSDDDKVIIVQVPKSTNLSI
jgi:ABC-type Na+ efflux pump permease subunit